MNLMKELPKIAFKVMQNTHMVPIRLKAKMDLLKACYGSAAVCRDFEDWCREHKDEHPRYPITDYLHVIDSRLGSQPAEETIPLTDPRIEALAAFAFETTGKQAPRRSLSDLLLTYTVEEIQAAMVELMESITEDNETKGALRSFYHDGGATAIILTRRKRAQHGR